MNFRAILLDIDGTISARDGAISPELVTVLARARAVGITVACATARTHPSSRIRLRDLGWVADEGVFHCGAMVVRGNQMTAAYELPPNIVTRAIAVARTTEPAVVVSVHHATRSPAFSIAIEEDLLRSWGYGGCERRSFEEALTQPATKISMWVPSEAAGSMSAAGAAVQAAISDMATVVRADEDRFIFMTAAGIDKAAGARTWLAEHGIDPAHTIAVGDDITDANLLALCGHGIAIAGGHSAALAVADEVVAGPPSDALARAIERALR